MGEWRRFLFRSLFPAEESAASPARLLEGGNDRLTENGLSGFVGHRLA
jgi:hypothetical protein